MAAVRGSVDVAGYHHERKIWIVRVLAVAQLQKKSETLCIPFMSKTVKSNA